MSMTVASKSRATFLGWRVNKGSRHAPEWSPLAGAPSGYALGGTLVINYMVLCDQDGIPVDGAPEKPANEALLRAMAETTGHKREQMEALLEIDDKLQVFGASGLRPLEMNEKFQGLLSSMSELIRLHREEERLRLELYASIAHEHGGW